MEKWREYGGKKKTKNDRATDWRGRRDVENGWELEIRETGKMREDSGLK